MIPCASKIVQERIMELGVNRNKLASIQFNGTDLAFLFYWREWAMLTIDQPGQGDVFLIDPTDKVFTAIRNVFQTHGQTIELSE